MEKRGFPRGQTTASRLKALFAHFEATRGRAEAEAWLGLVRIRPAEIEDETRLFPLVALCRALDAFAEALGASAIEDAAPGFLAKDNLGLWARLLRGASTPEAGFVRLDGTESEYGRTTLWETLESRPGLWRGRVRLAHDPRLEESGHLARLRASELSVVPCLFGYPRATVRRSGEGALQEYTVEWKLPVSEARSTSIGGTAGLFVALPAALAGALDMLGRHGLTYGALAVLVGGGMGVGVGHFVGRELRGRVEARAQSLRVAALERSLVLKELRESSAAGDLVGTMVAGQYRLGKSMGSGATGVIYEAVRVSDELPVAVKLLRAGAAHDTVASDRLRREAEALGLAWHPNVVEALDHGHLPDGSAYLVMELLRGQSLADRLRERGGRISPDELYPIALVLAEALSAIHAAGVIHRDIKPDNLFLVRADDAPNSQETVKILDFGIARVEWEEMRITNLGAPMGTAGYMAPEQEAGAEVDARADLYALGATFHECLVGEPPSADTTGARSVGSLNAMLRALDTAREPTAGSGVHRAANPVSRPHPWSEVLDRCLARSPDARFPDARSLARALRAMQEGPRAADEL